jgi:hypothetical protein
VREKKGGGRDRETEGRRKGVEEGDSAGGKSGTRGRWGEREGGGVNSSSACLPHSPSPALISLAI